MANIRGLSNIEQRFYRYELWEDFKSGMYNPRSNDDKIAKAIECLSDETLCRQHMKKAVSEWVIATEQNLTDPATNGRAWLGQCACFLYAGCHDEETRRAWVMMTETARKRANKIADEVIKEWLTEFSKQCPFYQLTIFDGE